MKLCSCYLGVIDLVVKTNCGRCGLRLRCGELSFGNWDGEGNPPVRCSEPCGHTGDHAGGLRGATVTWPGKTPVTRFNRDEPV